MPPEVTFTEKQMQEFSEQLQTINQKLQEGYAQKEIEEIVRQQLLLIDEGKRQAAFNSSLPPGFDGLDLKTLHEQPFKGFPIVDEFKEKADDLYTMAIVLKKNPRELKSYQEFQRIVKAVSSTGGSGGEWIPTGYSSQLFEKVRLAYKVAALFTEINMPTNPFKPPVLTTDIVAYLVPESTSDEIAATATISPSQPATSNFTLTAAKIGARVRVSDEATEDSLVPMLPTLKNNIGIALAYAVENGILNGDTTGTHMDADVTSARDQRKAWKGLRKIALTASCKQDISTYSIITLRTLRKSMGVYGVDPTKLAWIMSISAYLQALSLAGDGTNPSPVMTMEKYGPQATILSGELMKLDGIPVIVSQAQREDVDNTGVNGVSGNTKTTVDLVYRPAFIMGNKRGITLQTGADIENGQQILVATMREDFEPVYGTSAKAVGLGYNLAA